MEDLLYIGPATSKKLRGLGISTIGRLTQAPLDTLTRKLGKMESVAYRMRELASRCMVVEVYVRGAGFVEATSGTQLSLYPEDKRQGKWERIDAAGQAAGRPAAGGHQSQGRP